MSGYQPGQKLEISTGKEYLAHRRNGRRSRSSEHGKQGVPQDVSLDLVQTLYLGAFGRPADPPGLVFWTRRLKQAASVTPVLKTFSGSAEVRNRLEKLGEQAFIERAMAYLYGPGKAPMRSRTPTNSDLSILEQIVDFTRRSNPSERARLNSRLEQAHRFTWGVASSGVEYDHAVAAQVKELFSRSGLLFNTSGAITSLLRSLAKNAAADTSRRDPRLLRQLAASLPAAISRPERGASRKLRAVLHIGSEKTGSTSLQNFLTTNRQRLLQQGIAYLSSAERDDYRCLALYGVDSFVPDDYAYHRQLTDEEMREQWKDSCESDLAETLGALPEHVHTVILSSEHLQSRLKSAGSVALVRNLLFPCFKDIKVVVYLRRQDEVAVSRYSTHCRNGWLDEGLLPPNVQPEHSFYNYANLLDRWADAFDPENMIVRVFERARLVNHDVISDFFQSSGIDADFKKLETPKKKNESIPESAQVAVERLQQRYEVFREYRTHEQVREARLNIIEKVSRRFPGPHMKPLRAEAQDFAELFSASNNRVGQRWFHGEPVFSQDFGTYPQGRADPDYDLPEIDRIIDAEATKLLKELELPSQ
jgi:hypothetical protein